MKTVQDEVLDTIEGIVNDYDLDCNCTYQFSNIGHVYIGKKLDYAFKVDFTFNSMTFDMVIWGPKPNEKQAFFNFKYNEDLVAFLAALSETLMNYVS